MNPGLLLWLNQSPLPEDLSAFPWDMSINYLPIDVVRSKFEIMRTEFGAIVEQTEVTVNFINTFDKDTLISACVKFIITHNEFHGGKIMLSGTASFLRGQYPTGWAYSQIAESLATSRAFSKEWKQFGKGLNKIDSISDMKSPTGSKKSNAVDKTLKGL